MRQNFCKKCNVEFSNEVKFCPNCGSKTVYVFKTINSTGANKTNFDFIALIKSKKFLVIASIILGVVIVGIVAFSIIEMMTLDNNVKSKKDIVSANATTTFDSSKVGNIPCNICSGAYSVSADDFLYFACDDGIYKTCNFKESDIVKKSDSEKIADGKFCALNYFNEAIYCIDEKNNSVFKISNLNSDDPPYLDTVYKVDDSIKLKNFGIATNNLYMLSKNDTSYYLTSTSLSNKNIQNEVISVQASNAWLSVSETCLKLVCQEGNSWSTYKGDVDGGKTKGLTKYAGGTGIVSSIGFSGDKVYGLNNNSNSQKSIITIVDIAGNFNNAALERSAQKLLVADNCVFVQWDNSSFLWFNTDTNMTHDINNENFRDENVVAMNINNGKFCVLYTDGTVVLTDISSLT